MSKFQEYDNKIYIRNLINIEMLSNKFGQFVVLI